MNVLQPLLAMGGVSVLLVGWVLVQRLAERQIGPDCADLPETRREPQPTTCTACGSPCSVRVIPPPTMSPGAEPLNTTHRM